MFPASYKLSIKKLNSYSASIRHMPEPTEKLVHFTHADILEPSKCDPPTKPFNHL
ncbi:MAG: hypothetical protein WCC63_08580 [Candidatus Bathyarchaeia archaeon]